MLKKILAGLFFVLLVVAFFLFYKTRASGDIDDYASYYVHDAAPPDSQAVKVTYFGATTLLFDDGATQLLIDGFFSRPGMLRTLTSDISSDTTLIDQIMSRWDMNRVRGIFVTHTHYDHAFDVACTTRRTGAILYGSPSAMNIARGGGVMEDQMTLFNTALPVQVGRFTVQVIPSRHSPGNSLKDDGVSLNSPLRQPARFKAFPEGGSYDFLISHHGKRIYVKPSPNYIEGALDTLRADVLLLGTGIISRQPAKWQQKYYAETAGRLKPSILIPIHWDNFFYPLSEKLEMLPRFVAHVPGDFDFLIEKCKADQINFRILQGTKSILVR